MFSWNQLRLTHTEDVARPCYLGLGIGAELVLSDEQGRIPGVCPELVLAYRDHEISFGSEQQTTDRIGEPAVAYPQMARAFGQPGFDFYAVVHHPARNPLFQARFARGEL
jgi:hypothetical protein